MNSSVRRILWSRIHRTLSQPNVRRAAGYGLTMLILALLLLSRFFPGDVRMKVGQVSPRDVTSPVTAVITDENKTQELREQAAARVQKVYQEDNEALTKSLRINDGFFRDIAAIRGNSALDNDARRKQFADLLSQKSREASVVFPKDMKEDRLAVYLTSATDDDIASMRTQSASILTDTLKKSVTSDAMSAAYEQIDAQVGTLRYEKAAKEIIRLAATYSLRPNMVFNREATEAAIAEEMKRVQPVQRTILQGQIIIRSGDVVTEEHIDVLQKLGLQGTRSHSLVMLGIILFVATTVWVTSQYIKRFHPDIFEEDRLMLLLALISVLVIALARAIAIIKIGDRPEVNALIGYLMPVAAGSMLVTIMLDTRLAFFVTAIVSIYAGLMTESYGLSFVFAAFLGGVVGIFSVSKISQTTDLARAGLHVALANVAAVLGISILTSTVDLNTAGISVLVAVLNGFLSAVLMIGLLPYLESAFSVTSMIRLLELANPNQELLRQLLVETPGTYHHSIIVGNLAEAAAPTVHANPLLVRVGAYYHDIGKIKRPYFFVENQIGCENPHEKIAPSLSSLIITSHIKDGVELARDKKLPKPVIDIIEQHHGTSLVKYFYTRAVEEDRDGAVSEDTFRYEGPKPQTKEAALIMLADSVEAAVRAMPDPLPGKIEGMVRKVIKDKLNDGQLEECDLTFRDLAKIADSFSKGLVGTYHKRIEYPENVARDLKRKEDSRGNSGEQPTG